MKPKPLLIVTRHVIISMYYLTSNRSQLTIESLQRDVVLKKYRCRPCITIYRTKTMEIDLVETMISQLLTRIRVPVGIIKYDDSARLEFDQGIINSSVPVFNAVNYNNIKKTIVF